MKSTAGAKYNANGETLVYTLQNVHTHAHDYAGAESDTTILTPASGKRLEIYGIGISTNDKLTDVLLIGSNGNEVGKLYTTNTATGGSVDMHLDLDVDETLQLTCGAGTFIVVNFHEA